MATNNIQMVYDLAKNTSQRSSVYGRYFARVQRKSTLSTRGLAEHLIKHGVIANRADLEAILIKLSECIPELVAQGYGVKLDGLGTFYPTIENEKGGAATAEDFNATENIKGAHLRFCPDQTDLDNLCINGFTKKVVFRPGNLVEITRTTVAGKVKRTHKLTPLVEVQEEPEP